LLLLLTFLPELKGGWPVFAWSTGTMTMALPGLATLAFINWFAIRQFSGGRGGGGPVAA